MDVTVEKLKRRWTEMLVCADESAGRRPGAYSELKSLVRRINTETVDISEYYPLAKRLTHLMETIDEVKHSDIFDYFLKQIDPGQKGSAMHFRYLCADLQRLLEKIDCYRKSRRCLKIVK